MNNVLGGVHTQYNARVVAKLRIIVLWKQTVLVYSAASEAEELWDFHHAMHLQDRYWPTRQCQSMSH